MKRAEPLRVPPRFRAGILAVAQLDPKAVERLAKVFSSAEPSLRPGWLTGSLVDALPDVAESQLDSIVTAVLSLYRGSDDLDQNIGDFIDDLVQSPDLELPEDARPILAARLKTLTTSQALFLTAKALGIATAHERSFHAARIFSDIRPIFGSDIQTGPPVAVVNHMLALSFHGSSGELEDLYFGMSSTDLDELEEVVKRARDKARTLDDLLRRAAVTPLAWSES